MTYAVSHYWAFHLCSLNDIYYVGYGIICVVCLVCLDEMKHWLQDTLNKTMHKMRSIFRKGTDRKFVRRLCSRLKHNDFLFEADNMQFWQWEAPKQSWRCMAHGETRTEHKEHIVQRWRKASVRRGGQASVKHSQINDGGQWSGLVYVHRFQYEWVNKLSMLWVC